MLVPAGNAALHADVVVPEAATGLVFFAHGSGSSRLSPRNRQVAATLQEAGLATVLADLLTQEEERADRDTRCHRFDIDLLAPRLAAVAEWCRTEPAMAELPVGLFGASTGAAAALRAAADSPAACSAVVSRGGRPDLAESSLRSVRAPTLLIVGSLDTAVLDLNRSALGQLGGEGALEVVAGASHLFEEPGTLEEVARLARDWFLRHLGPLGNGTAKGG